MIMSVRFCLPYDILNVIILPSKFVYFNEKLHFFVTDVVMTLLVAAKSYVTCSHNIIYDMTLSTE